MFYEAFTNKRYKVTTSLLPSFESFLESTGNTASSAELTQTFAHNGAVTIQPFWQGTDNTASNTPSFSPLSCNPDPTCDLTFVRRTGRKKLGHFQNQAQKQELAYIHFINKTPNKELNREGLRTVMHYKRAFEKIEDFKITEYNLETFGDEWAENGKMFRTVKRIFENFGTPVFPPEAEPTPTFAHNGAVTILSLSDLCQGTGNTASNADPTPTLVSNGAFTILPLSDLCQGTGNTASNRPCAFEL